MPAWESWRVPICTESSPLPSTLAMSGQTGPSWLSASQSFLCGELHQAGQVVVLIPSPSSHAQLDSMVVSPFVEVLQSRPLPRGSVLQLHPLSNDTFDPPRFVEARGSLTKLIPRRA